MRLTTENTAQSLRDLRKGIADLAIIITCDAVSLPYDLHGIERCDIGSDRLVVVRAAHVPESATQLLSHRSGSYIKACTMHLLKCDTSLKALPLAFESSSSHLHKAMALAGFGVAVLQESLIEDEIRDGYLISLIKQEDFLPCRIQLVRADKPIHKQAEAIWAKARS